MATEQTVAINGFPKFSNGTPLWIGARNGIDSFFNGWIDNLTIQDYALSDAEVSAAYSARSAGYLADTSGTAFNSGSLSPVGQWALFDEGTGSHGL